jgi:glycerophosphoryl diester phosphodiesterase
LAAEKRGKDHPFFLASQRIPEVIAHRGGAGENPGETIYAFEEARKLGVDILEMDIRYTSDEDLILMHNSNVLETTGVDKRVNEFTSAAIQKLDAAYWWRKTGKVFPPGAKLGVPRLEDVFLNFSDVRLNIEIKPFHFPLRLIKKLIELIRKYNMTERVLIASAWHRHLVLFRRLCPEVATSASGLEMFCFRVLKNVGYKPNADAIQLSSKAGPFHFITQKYVDNVRRINLKVHGWTVNQPEEMGRLISFNVDGIITDYPTTLM